MILASIELPVLIVYIVMAIGFIGLIWGAKNQNTKPNARIVMFASVAVVIGAVAASFMVGGAKSEDARLMRNVKQFQTAKAEKVASYISDRFPGGAVAFLIDESSLGVPANEYGNSFVLEELQKRLSEKGISVGDTLVVGKSKEVVDKSGQASTVVEDPTNAEMDGPVARRAAGAAGHDRAGLGAGRCERRIQDAGRRNGDLHRRHRAGELRQRARMVDGGLAEYRKSAGELVDGDAERTGKDGGAWTSVNGRIGKNGRSARGSP